MADRFILINDADLTPEGVRALFEAREDGCYPIGVVKWLPIADLPESYYRNRLSEVVFDPAEAIVPIVARIGWVGDWSAYVGWPAAARMQPEYLTEYGRHCADRLSSATGAMQWGSKWLAEEAVQLFPVIAAVSVRGYRE